MISRPSAAPYSPAFLEPLVWCEGLFRFTVARPVALPALCGSALRGLLGQAWREALCPLERVCPAPPGVGDAVTCREPAHCPYFEVFEQSRRGGLEGENVVKPFVIEPPLPASFASLGAGRPPDLRPARLEPGEEIDCGVTLLGADPWPLEALAERLAARPRRLQGGAVELAAWRRGVGLRLDLSAPETGRVRVRLLSPLAVKLEGGARPAAEELAERFLEFALVRAVRLAGRFGAGERPPFLAPPAGIRLAGAPRLVAAGAERFSTRKLQRMRFEGWMGEFELEGDLGPAIPLLRAAERFHVGQKAAFGFGRVEWGVDR